MQTELETYLSELIAIPSVTSDSAACHAVLEYMRTEMEPYGLFIHSELTTPNPWFYATTKDTKEPDILLAAHLDVVPAPPELFKLRKEDGKLFGRGVYDMKLAAAFYLALLKNHADTLHSLNIGFLFTTDEEIGGSSMNDVLASGLRPKVVFIPDGGDNWAVEKRAKGLHGVKLTAKGKTAHGSRPWEGDNALHALLKALVVLQTAYPNVTDMSASTLSINTVNGGEAMNQVPGSASAQIDFRSFSRDDLAQFKKLLNEVAATYELEITVNQTGDPLLFDEQAPGVDDFVRALQAHTGQDEIRYCESYGASDGRYFAKYNIPSIIIEPTGGARHSPEEWVKADDLPRYYQLMERWLISSN